MVCHRRCRRLLLFWHSRICPVAPVDSSPLIFSACVLLSSDRGRITLACRCIFVDLLDCVCCGFLLSHLAGHFISDFSYRWTLFWCFGLARWAYRKCIQAICIAALAIIVCSRIWVYKLNSSALYVWSLSSSLLLFRPEKGDQANPASASLTNHGDLNWPGGVKLENNREAANLVAQVRHLVLQMGEFHQPAAGTYRGQWAQAH